MKKTTDKSRVYTMLALVFSFLQTLVPFWGLSDVSVSIVTTICITLAAIFTIKKQRVSVEIDRKAVIWTWVLIGVAAIGGLNELVGKIGLSESVQNILRNIIVALMGLYNIASKSLFPTQEGKLIQDVKKDLKEGNFGRENTVDVPLDN